MTKLIALIDGSIYSKSVCDHTAWAAGRTGANVEIIHVLGHQETSTEPVNLSGNIGLGARTALLEELAEHDAKTAKLSQKRGRMILADAKARLLSDGLDKVSTRLRLDGIAETIQNYEKDTNFRLKVQKDGLLYLDGISTLMRYDKEGDIYIHFVGKFFDSKGKIFYEGQMKLER